jgi:hypothetical protein
VPMAIPGGDRRQRAETVSFQHNVQQNTKKDCEDKGWVVPEICRAGFRRSVRVAQQVPGGWPTQARSWLECGRSLARAGTRKASHAAIAKNKKQPHIRTRVR